MSGLISICIPSYQRPTSLLEAVQSCFCNTYRPLEILIGDDSRNDESERLLLSLRTPDGVAIHYRRNADRLGQPANVNSLFDDAQGDRLILLHDDDRLTPGAIDVLHSIWASNNDLAAVFGKQQVIDAQGRTLVDETTARERALFRTPDREGIQASAVSSALMSQFPMDGYLLETAAARAVRYSTTTFRGDGSDFDFGVRFALYCNHKKFYFTNHYLSDYRNSPDAISLVSFSQSYKYEMLSSIDVPKGDLQTLQETLCSLAPGALTELARRGLRRKALSVYRSQHYSRRRYSLKGMYHLASIALPAIAGIRARHLYQKRAQNRLHVEH